MLFKKKPGTCFTKAGVNGDSPVLVWGAPLDRN